MRRPKLVRKPAGAAEQRLAAGRVVEHRARDLLGGLLVLLRAGLGQRRAGRADVVEEVRLGVVLERRLRQAGAEQVRDALVVLRPRQPGQHGDARFELQRRRAAVVARALARGGARVGLVVRAVGGRRRRRRGRRRRRRGRRLVLLRGGARVAARREDPEEGGEHGLAAVRPGDVSPRHTAFNFADLRPGDHGFAARRNGASSRKNCTPRPRKATFGGAGCRRG
jgi:hypothetical protein